MARKRIVKLPRSVSKLYPNVTTAYDADKSVEVHVKNTDIKGSLKHDPTGCAMARAVGREYHAAAIIGKSYSYIIKGKQATRFKTPESVAREIVSFDRHGDFEPGDYYLRPCSPSNRLGKRIKSSGPSGNHYKRKYHKIARVRTLREAK